MQRGFGIRIAPCRFRQDNRDYYIDHAGKAISDALTSVKHISRRVADTLYIWRDRFYPCFTDLLYDMEMHPAFDSQVVEILIRLGYFQEFGSSGKLLKLFHEFREGEFKFSKAHIPATQEKRQNRSCRSTSKFASKSSCAARRLQQRPICAASTPYWKWTTVTVRRSGCTTSPLAELAL